MKQGLLCALEFVVLGLFGLAASPATADTVAAGPYYATPSWDQTLPVATRFIVLSNMNSAAVLDRETGLVWLQSPGTQVGFGNYVTMANQCQNMILGNRMGWRLPTLQETMSLIDPSQTSGLALPSGHPFTQVSGGLYWTATQSISAPGNLNSVSFTNLEVPPSPPKFVGAPQPPLLNIVQINAWCVRSGEGVSPQ